MKTILMVLLVASMAVQPSPISSTPESPGEAASRQDLSGLFHGWSHTKYDRGHYVAFDSWRGPQIGIFDENGSQVARFPVKIAEAAKAWLYDVALQPDGKVIASGWAAKTDGSHAPFIARIGTGGAIETLLRTDSFAPETICVTGNGSLWAIGLDPQVETRDAAANYPILRQFSFSGAAVRKAVSKTTLSKEHLVPGWMHLGCSDSAATVFYEKTGEIVQFNFRDGTVRQWHIGPMPVRDASVTGFAVTPANDVFVTVMNRKSTPRTHVLLQARLSPGDSAEWTTVADASGAKIGDSRIRLLGSSGPDLMLERGAVGMVYRVPLQ